MIRTFGWILLVTSIHTVAAQEAYNKARAALGARDTAAAVSAFLEAVKLGQKSAESNYYLGAISLHRGKVDDAIGYLRASLKSNDENSDALVLLGNALLLRKDIPGAMSNYRLAVKYGKKNPVPLTALGKAQLAVDSVDAAIRTLTEAELYGETAEIEALLGEAYEKQNVLVLAITKYQKAVELEPKTITWHVKLARAFYKNRQYTEAVKEHDVIIGIDSAYAGAYLEKARILVAAKLWQQAVPVCRKLVQLQPKLPEGWVLYARALFGADDYAECVKVSRQALQLDSTSVDVWRALAHSLVETRDYAGSLGAFDGLKRRGKIAPPDMMKLGLALQQLKRDDEALQLLLSAVAADSANCDPYFALGSIYMNKRDYPSAAAAFEKKIACDPRSLSAYINASACYMQPPQNLVRARELLLKAIELKSDFLLGRLWLGRVYAMMDSLPMSDRQYDEVLQIIGTQTDKYRKEAGEANAQRGQNFFIRKQYEQAIEYLRRALALGYETGSIQLTMGQALILSRGDNAEENKKKNEEAVKHFRRCVELERGNAQGHLWLAQGLLFLREEGNNPLNRQLVTEACSEYKVVLKLEPKNQDAAKGIERIGCK